MSEYAKTRNQPQKECCNKEAKQKAAAILMRKLMESQL